jgi:signal transduction histidine kinase
VTATPVLAPGKGVRHDRTAFQAAFDVRATANWHALWALATAAGLALVLALLGSPPATVVFALLCGGAPGVAGWVDRRPSGSMRVLAIWAIGCGLAVGLSGGITGPLMAWCVGPVLAAAAYGGLWRQGAALSFGVLSAVAMLQLAGATPQPPQGALSFILGLTGLVTTMGGAAAALMMLNPGRGASATIPYRSTGLSTGLGTSSGTGEAPADGRPIDDRLAEAEAGRERAEAEARAKARFLANMSHELRTPLNAIMGFSDIMRSRLFGELPPKYEEYAQLIHESGQHLLDLINDVLDVTKIEADKYVLSTETFDVREVANAALRILRQQADDAGLKLRGVLPAEPLLVRADRRAVKQMVLNLVSNALKFTPAGGAVTVTFSQGAGALDIVVADTGVGIAPEDLARLGRPFEQAGDADDRARGTGLGLSLVRAFARLHGGDMSIESRLGEGTAVTVRLPVLATAVEPVKA